MVKPRKFPPESEQRNPPGGHDETPPVELEVRDIIDLHTFPPRDIPEIVAAYLEEARRKGFTTVRIIHGKGVGVQRERVHAVLRRTPFVEHFQMAPAESGSWGATIVWFKPASQWGGGPVRTIRCEGFVR